MNPIRVACVLSLIGACATPQAAERPLSACDLEHETACVAYGAQLEGGPQSPSGQLIIGLSARAAELPDSEAVDYWRRIDELVSASTDQHEFALRAAAPAYASLAALAVGDVESSGDDLERALTDAQKALERVRAFAEFAVRWGDASTQARAARAIADGYGRQAQNLASFVMPSELTLTGKAAFEAKRDQIVGALKEQQRELLEGVATHCRRAKLSIPACEVDSELEL